MPAPDDRPHLLVKVSQGGQVQFGSNQTVAYQVSGGGSVSNSGLYTAPTGSNSTDTVVAVNGNGTSDPILVAY